MTHEDIAMVTHEVNRYYCMSIGDNNHPEWDDAPDWMKKNEISGVIYHLTNPNAGAEDSHNAWLKEKELDGWKYGAVKDALKKEHPCFVPYDKLPVEQKTKDYIFLAIVRSLAKFVK